MRYSPEIEHMLSKAQIKYITSFHRKKVRQEHRMYMIEGVKAVHELLLAKTPVKALFATNDWLEENNTLIQAGTMRTTVTESELQKVSALSTANKVLALAEMPHTSLPNAKLPDKGLYLVLDNLRDPGNMGTIIRTADWFGANAIICSEDCVEIFNPKVVQASMGSLFHLPIYTEVNLQELLNQNKGLPSFAATLDGVNIFEERLPESAMLFIGNESAGIKPELVAACSQQLTIPRYGKAESLNAGTATAILLSCFKRK